MGDEDETSDDEHSAMEEEEGDYESGNHFRTIPEMAEEAAALCDQYAPSPRAVSSTTPIPRKTKTTQTHMQEFNENFGRLAGAIASSIEGKKQDRQGNDKDEERLKKLEDNVESVSNQVNSNNFI